VSSRNCDQDRKKVLLWIGRTYISDVTLKEVPIGTSSIDWDQPSRSYLKTETESSLHNVVFWKINRMVFKDKMMDNVQKQYLYLKSFSISRIYNIEQRLWKMDTPLWKILVHHWEAITRISRWWIQTIDVTMCSSCQQTAYVNIKSQSTYLKWMA
jgi:hypothetical protein